MKRIFYIFLSLSLLATFSCEDLVEGINDNPNKIAIEDVDPRLFLKGPMLVNVQLNYGHLPRIAALWSGQLIGFQSLYKTLYEYNITAAESVATWEDAYQGALNQLRFVQENLPNDRIYQGISKVVEAQIVGNMASLFGDIPYREATDPEIDDPAFDPQAQVFDDLQNLLDEAIQDLEAVNGNPSVDADIYYGGNPALWIEAAWTLKARFYTLTRQYEQAFMAAQNGISSPENTMFYKPVDDENQDNDNLFFKLLNGSRTGDIGTGDSFAMQLLDVENPDSRNHAKTNEQARRAYLTIDESRAVETGIAGRVEPMPLLTYAENQLILAETAARNQGLDAGLPYLNELRAELDAGNLFDVLADTLEVNYEPFEAADFQTGGIENPDGVAAERAFLREVIEERYISGFAQLIAFDDARRLRSTDPDLVVPFPLNIGSANEYPERFIYANSEINANSNAPTPPGILVPTPINQ
jgi:hypothetical protein